jgi:signal transduction histidine kinase
MQATATPDSSGGDRPAASRRTARTVAIVAIVLCAGASVAAFALRATAPPDPSPATIVVIGDPTADRVQEVREESEALIADGARFGQSQASTVIGLIAVLLACLGWMAVGALIVSTQPRNWAGWIFLAIGATLPLTNLCQVLATVGARRDPGSIPLIGPIAYVGFYLIFPIAMLPLLFLLYPDGHVPSRGWRWAVRGLLGGTSLAIVGYVLSPGPINSLITDGILYVNPTGIDGFGSVSSSLIRLGTIVALISSLSTVVAIRQRYRRSTGTLREQMRLLVLVAATAGATMLLGFVGTVVGALLGREDDPAFFLALFAFLVLTLLVGVPGAYLIAIFRHGLWDMGLVIRKTVQYGVLVVAFMLLGFVIVALVPTLLIGVGGTDYVSTVIIAAFLAAIFLWLRPRAARFANRLVYGRRATPYEVLSEFSERVGETYSTDDVLPRMAHLLVQATGARRADVWLRVGTELRCEARWPTDVDPPPRRLIRGDEIAGPHDDYLAEVRHQDELLGAITLDLPADDPMNPSKEALVRDLAAQAGLVLRNVRLIEELRASRQRLVAAQDEERRKLERNIHDGVQQQLVALTVQLRLAEQLTERDPAKARELLASLQGRTNEALEDLRDLARGIYPPLLADKGLATALEAQGRKSPVPVTVRADDITRYPQAVESAVYFSCLEALNNVAKYAEAQHVTITLARRDGSLAFDITDDGRGFDTAVTTHGTGLQGIADRLDALGGTMRIESAAGEGTSLHGTVPASERQR